MVLFFSGRRHVVGFQQSRYTQCRSVLTSTSSLFNRDDVEAIFIYIEGKKNQLKYLSELKLGGINVEWYKCNSTIILPYVKEKSFNFQAIRTLIK